MHKKITFIGFITNVDSGKIDVRISNDIPSASPIIDGIQYSIGQIGTLVRIPLGNTMLFGVVDSVNISGVDQTKMTLIDHDLVNRNIRVNLIGEKIGRGVFQKGIGVFPTINDEVHIVTESDIKSIYDFDSTGQIELGTHASSNDLPIYLDLQKIISRHLAILGSTGSGKSNTTARVISSILEKFEGSRIILIDIHGEYSSAFPAKSKVMRLNSPDSPLYIPYWAMNFDELSFFLVGREAGSERPEDKRLREEIVRLKRKIKIK
ncbi:ATP-binding protein [Acholeplasma laidlawii]|uniref:ATP-binding protein n=1 Tax=Acholeplasma laidlawii TaxID=2148 RepID=UPI000B20224D|nr:ATP-binding protein [Acholeplasma laidlawii]